MISLRDKGGYQPVGELQSNTGHLSLGKQSIGDDPAKKGGCQLCHEDCDTQDPLQICLITLITDCYTWSTVLCIVIWSPPPPWPPIIGGSICFIVSCLILPFLTGRTHHDSFGTWEYQGSCFTCTHLVSPSPLPSRGKVADYFVSNHLDKCKPAEEGKDVEDEEEVEKVVGGQMIDKTMEGAVCIWTSCAFPGKYPCNESSTK